MEITKKITELRNNIFKLSTKNYERQLTEQEREILELDIKELEIALFEEKLIKKSLKALGGPGITRAKFEKTLRISQMILDDIFNKDGRLKERPFEMINILIS